MHLFQNIQDQTSLNKKPCYYKVNADHCFLPTLSIILSVGMSQGTRIDLLRNSVAVRTILPQWDIIAYTLVTRQYAHCISLSRYSHSFRSHGLHKLSPRSHPPNLGEVLNWKMLKQAVGELAQAQLRLELGLPLINPNYPEVFLKQFILGGGAIIIPPKIDHFNGFCKFCFFRGLGIYRGRIQNLRSLAFKLVP